MDKRFRETYPKTKKGFWVRLFQYLKVLREYRGTILSRPDRWKADDTVVIEYSMPEWALIQYQAARLDNGTPVAAAEYEALKRLCEEKPEVVEL